MPDRALQFCQHVGCPELTTSRFCPAHAAEHEAQAAQAQTRYNKERGSAAAQGYDQDWVTVRNVYIRRHPLCEDCLLKGKIHAAEMVHHIKPIQEGGERLDMQNLRSLCAPHHEQIHGKDRWKRKDAKE